ncbi:isoprenylcysteine carboxylmethyltransferase family protein [Sphingomonas sp.]|uniref:methyltransferase family protein n=1 Tax=Sphingomonas sp. TaxID=28214 RepID=UPI0025DF3DEA|nr:isoprenylcysteine carboxylmethyltransferase family protein [Sphingomonas sp.]
MSAPLIALYIGWTIWATLWVLTSWWSARRVSRAGGGQNIGYQLISAAGMLALLIVTRPTRPLFSPLWQMDEAIAWALVVLMAAGFLLACWARFALGKLWSAGVERKEGHRLVEEGPYAIVRHPIYTGLLAAALAVAVVKATPLALIGLVLTAVGFTVKARLEEQFLSAELGEAHYADYRRRVPMLVPFLPTR